MTAKIYSYVLRYDDGAAPNPFWNICTLTICKPRIRKTAEIGDWVIGTGSANAWITNADKVNLEGHLVYAMKITDKMPLDRYDQYCRKYLQNKIPIKNAMDWRARMGDCIYFDFLLGDKPSMRQGVHNEANRDRDLSGVNALLSNQFYYFGLAARELPIELKPLIKQNQGHRIIEQPDLIAEFENWLKQFEINKLYADPQLRWEYDKEAKDHVFSKCAKQHYEDDEDETCEKLC